MNWKDNFIWVIETTLNEGRECEDLYHVQIIDDHNVVVNYGETTVLKRRTLHSIESHWRQECREIINAIMKDKINLYLSKVKKT